MFKAGTLSKDELKVSDEGVVEGSMASPILSNIFAHYVIDRGSKILLKSTVVAKWICFATVMIWWCVANINKMRSV